MNTLARAMFGRHAATVLAMVVAAPQIAQAQSAGTGFFLTSSGIGNGGNLGGLAGADNHCQTLAQAAGAGGKTWRAYLSTQAADARPPGRPRAPAPTGRARRAPPAGPADPPPPRRRRPVPGARGWSATRDPPGHRPPAPPVRARTGCGATEFRRCPGEWRWRCGRRRRVVDRPPRSRTRRRRCRPAAVPPDTGHCRARRRRPGRRTSVCAPQPRTPPGRPGANRWRR